MIYDRHVNKGTRNAGTVKMTQASFLLGLGNVIVRYLFLISDLNTEHCGCTSKALTEIPVTPGRCDPSVWCSTLAGSLGTAPLQVTMFC